MGRIEGSLGKRREGSGRGAKKQGGKEVKVKPGMRKKRRMSFTTVGLWRLASNFC